MDCHMNFFFKQTTALTFQNASGEIFSSDKQKDDLMAVAKTIGTLEISLKKPRYINLRSLLKLSWHPIG